MSSRYGDVNSPTSGGGRRQNKPNLVAENTGGIHGSRSTTASIRHNRSGDESDLLSTASGRSIGNDNSSAAITVRKRLDQSRQQHYLNETVTSVARKATTDDFLHHRHQQDSYGLRSDVSVVSGDASTRGGGASIVSTATAASRISRKKPTMTLGKVVGAAPETASRRFTSSASVYSETRKQKLVLDQNSNAAAKVGTDAERSNTPDRDREGGVSVSSRGQKKKKKKKRPNWYHRDPDSCVKVSIRIHPEPEDVPKCVEIRKFAHSAWDDDDDESEIDDDVFIYNGIRIFDENHDGDDKKEQEFNFDNIFEPTSAHDEIYAKAVAPLVESSCCQGFNATVLAYGETATGKTHTLLGHAHHNPKNAASPSTKPGSPKTENVKSTLPPKAVSSAVSCASSVASSIASYTTFGELSAGAGTRLLPEVAIIPRALYSVFRLLESMKQALTSDTTDFDFTVKVQFLEVYDNEIWDLLSDPKTSKVTTGPVRAVKGNQTTNAKVSLRFTGPNPPYITGAAQPAVKSAEEAWHHVRLGRRRRHTAKTDKNATSSRSHAIFSVLITQTTTVKTMKSMSTVASVSSTSSLPLTKQDGILAGQETRTKLNFVDLAAPQRNTSEIKALDPARFKEQCDINQSLLNLRLVIRAVVEQQEHQKEAQSNKKVASAHKRIPYRDSKLTSLLQGSIGGDHKVVMIACLSPAASNIDHSWECLKYMNKIQHIENKATPNIDHFSHASFYSREQKHRQQKDDASAQSIPSCSSTIVTRHTYSSAKQNYEVPSKHSILGLVQSISADAEQRVTSPSPSRLSSTGSSPAITPDRPSAWNNASSTSSGTGRLHSSDDDLPKGDEWDATLDDLLGNDLLDDNRPQSVVVVTPGVETSKKQTVLTGSTYDETPVHDEGQSGTPKLRTGRNIATSGIISPYVNSYETPRPKKALHDSKFATPTTEANTPTTNRLDDLKEFDAFNSDSNAISERSDHSKESDLAGMKHLPDSYDSTPRQRGMVSASALDDKLKDLSEISASILPIKAPLTTRQVTSPSRTQPISKIIVPAATKKSLASVKSHTISDKRTFASIGRASTSRTLDLSKPVHSFSPKRTPRSPSAQYSPLVVNESLSTTSSAVSYLFADDNSSFQSNIANISKVDSSLDLGAKDTQGIPRSPKMALDLQTLKLDLQDDDNLFSFVGRVMLRESDSTEMELLQNLQNSIRIVFEKRNDQETAANITAIRNVVYSAAESDHQAFLKLLEIDNELPDVDDYEIQRRTGYWICRSQLDQDQKDTKGSSFTSLINAALSRQAIAPNTDTVFMEMKRLLKQQIKDEMEKQTPSVDILHGNVAAEVTVVSVEADIIYRGTDIEKLTILDAADEAKIVGDTIAKQPDDKYLIPDLSSKSSVVTVGITESFSSVQSIKADESLSSENVILVPDLKVMSSQTSHSDSQLRTIGEDLLGESTYVAPMISFVDNQMSKKIEIRPDSETVVVQSVSSLPNTCGEPFACMSIAEVQNDLTKMPRRIVPELSEADINCSLEEQRKISVLELKEPSDIILSESGDILPISPLETKASVQEMKKGDGKSVVDVSKESEHHPPIHDAIGHSELVESTDPAIKCHNSEQRNDVYTAHKQSTVVDAFDKTSEIDAVSLKCSTNMPMQPSHSTGECSLSVEESSQTLKGDEIDLDLNNRTEGTAGCANQLVTQSQYSKPLSMESTEVPNNLTPESADILFASATAPVGFDCRTASKDVQSSSVNEQDGSTVTEDILSVDILSVDGSDQFGSRRSLRSTANAASWLTNLEGASRAKILVDEQSPFNDMEVKVDCSMINQAANVAESCAPLVLSISDEDSEKLLSTCTLTITSQHESNNLNTDGLGAHRRDVDMDVNHLPASTPGALQIADFTPFKTALNRVEDTEAGEILEMDSSIGLEAGCPIAVKVQVTHPGDANDVMMDTPIFEQVESAAAPAFLESEISADVATSEDVHAMLLAEADDAMKDMPIFEQVESAIAPAPLGSAQEIQTILPAENDDVMKDMPFFEQIESAFVPATAGPENFTEIPTPQEREANLLATPEPSPSTQPSRQTQIECLTITSSTREPCEATNVDQTLSSEGPSHVMQDSWHNDLKLEFDELEMFTDNDKIASPAFPKQSEYGCPIDFTAPTMKQVPKKVGNHLSLSTHANSVDKALDDEEDSKCNDTPFEIELYPGMTDVFHGRGVMKSNQWEEDHVRQLLGHDPKTILLEDGPDPLTIDPRDFYETGRNELITAPSVMNVCEVSNDNELTRIEIERERQRQEEYAEAIARTCCSISCLGRTIEAYYYDYGFQSDHGVQNSSDPQRVVPKKRRSWISRMMGIGDSAVSKLPPPPSAGILPEESRLLVGKTKRRESASFKYGVP